MAHPEILLCTVGTGTIDQLRDTLLEPLKKSIRQGEWRRVILLPSQLTAANAECLRHEVADVAIAIKPLPREGTEDDPDACFAHFDAILTALRADGTAAESILVDFTRGTKVMSAALVLAAIRHDVPRLRYISGPRGRHGNVLPGQEQIADFGTAVVSARKRLDEIHQFFRHGNFAAALEFLTAAGQAWPAEMGPLVSLLACWAEFYSAWDRLDYEKAHGVSLTMPTPLPDPTWARLAPTAAMRDWVERLGTPFPADTQARAVRLRFQVLDILANAERRLRDRHFEDTIIRAYRIVEMVSQLRLFCHGLDAGALPVDHPAVRDLQDKLMKDRDEIMIPLRRPPGFLQAGRLQVGRLLKRLKDPLHGQLLRLGDHAFITKRNKGILIHGYEPIGSTDATTLREFLLQLEKLVHDDGQLAGFDVTANLRTARSCAFSF